MGSLFFHDCKSIEGLLEYLENSPRYFNLCTSVLIKSNRFREDPSRITLYLGIPKWTEKAGRIVVLVRYFFASINSECISCTIGPLTRV